MDTREQVLHAFVHDLHMTLASINTFPASSQLMLASKRYMLSCMILHVFKLDARVHYSSSIQ